MEPRPNTVLLNCHRFQELPTEAQVAEWFGNHLFIGEVANLLGKVGGLDIEEREKRVMVQLSSSEEVDQLLARMGEEGVEWPEFVDPATNQPIRIRGFSADNSSLRVTLLDVPRDVEDDIIRTALAQYGTVQEVKRHHLIKPGMEHILVNRVSVKLSKDREVELPTHIYGLGSSINGGDRSIWRVTYPGAPRRCYRCGNPNHMARDCRRPPITMQQVEKMPAVGEVRPAGVQQEQQPMSFAAVVKSAKYLEAAALEVTEMERLRKLKEDKKVADDQQKNEERKAKEEAIKAKVEEKRVEEDAKRSAHLAELAKNLEKAALHKKYVKNLHDQAQAEVEETAGYEKGMEKMMRWREEEVGRNEGTKRPPSSPAGAATPSKKTTPNQQHGGT